MNTKTDSCKGSSGHGPTPPRVPQPKELTNAICAKNGHAHLRQRVARALLERGWLPFGVPEPSAPYCVCNPHHGFHIRIARCQRPDASLAGGVCLSIGAGHEDPLRLCIPPHTSDTEMSDVLDFAEMNALGWVCPMCGKDRHELFIYLDDEKCDVYCDRCKIARTGRKARRKRGVSLLMAATEAWPPLSGDETVARCDAMVNSMLRRGAFKRDGMRKPNNRTPARVSAYALDLKNAAARILENERHPEQGDQARLGGSDR